MLGKIFTWWNGATVGTALMTWLSGGKVGEDGLGNVYYQKKRGRDGTLPRRWVIYNGSNDASRVPAEWHGWLHNTVEALPEQSLPPRRPWERPALANATGTPRAYRPPGALEKGGVRAPATGDYEAWTPEDA